MSNVYEYIQPASRAVLRSILFNRAEVSLAELAHLNQMDTLELQQAIQQLLSTNMVVMHSSSVGSSFETRYDLADFVRPYLTKYHPILTDELKKLTRSKNRLVSENDRVLAALAANPYSPFHVVMRSKSDLVVAKYLIEALQRSKASDFVKARELIDRAKSMAPGFYEVHRCEAWVNAQEGNNAAARDAYEVAVELEPKSAVLRQMVRWFPHARCQGCRSCG